MTKPTNAEIVMMVGEALYGNQAVDRLAARLPMAKRTVERIAAAARDGEDYPAARAALRELTRLIEAGQSSLQVLLETVREEVADRLTH